MKKGWFLVGIIFLLVPWLVVGCGVSEEVYNAVVAERDAAQAQVTTLQSELSGAQAQVESLQNDLSKAQEQITKLEGDFSDAEAEIAEFKEFKSDLTLAWNSLNKDLGLALSFLEIECKDNKFQAGIISESELNEFMAGWMTGMITLVSASRDPEIVGYWDDLWSAAMEGDEEKGAFCLISIEDRIVELVEDGIAEVNSILR